MTGTSQLPLAFPPRTALGSAAFVVAEPNRAAMAWIERWPDWSAPVVTLHGPAGCGKTHLLHMFLDRSGGHLLPAEALEERAPGELLGAAPAAALDDADRALSSAGDAALLHLLNWAGESGVPLLLTGREPPARWPVRLPDLGSRLNAAPAVGIGAPDDALLRAVLVKRLEDRGLRLDAAVLDYLLARMERSFAAAAWLAARLDAASLDARRSITIPFVRDLLDSGDRR